MPQDPTRPGSPPEDATFAISPPSSTPIIKPTASLGAAGGINPKIKSFGPGSASRHEDKWTRTPNTNGTGAIHVRSFHAKMSEDGLAFLDQAINEWLDAHPQYEVKLVTTAVGEWVTKLGKEPGLVVNVWV